MIRSGLTAVEVEDFCCNDAAAAAENPTVERREEKGIRRKAEENSLKDLEGV